MKSRPKLYCVLSDIHYPEHDKKALNAVFDFLSKNKVDGLILNGDSLDFSCCSHHVPKQARKRGGLKSDLDGFDKQILRKLEILVPKNAERKFGKGNHCRFLDDYLTEENPELEGMLSVEGYLGLKERGWEVGQLGYSFQIGRLNVMHGDSLGSGVHAAKKALDVVSDNVMIGHGHQVQCYSKTSPIKQKHKICSWMCGCLCNLTQNYGKGRANAWIHAFGLVYVYPNGQFNVYVPIICDGTFLWNGTLYGAR